jgi:hypothetical protein
MRNARDHKCNCRRDEDCRVTARNLERGKQDQENRHVLGEVGVRSHPPQHHVITAIADANLQWPARSNDTGTQPDIPRAAAAAGKQA